MVMLVAHRKIDKMIIGIAFDHDFVARRMTHHRATPRAFFGIDRIAVTGGVRAKIDFDLERLQFAIKHPLSPTARPSSDQRRI